MSMNFYIDGNRSITVNKTGKVETSTTTYHPWQTPTKVTNEILMAPSPIEAYKAWVMSISKDEEELVYAEDDHFSEREPIGTKTINYGKAECESVDEWIADVLENGYELEFYRM